MRSEKEGEREREKERERKKGERIVIMDGLRRGARERRGGFEGVAMRCEVGNGNGIWAS